MNIKKLSHRGAHAGVDHHHVTVLFKLINNGVIDDFTFFIKVSAVYAASGGEGLFGLADAGIQVIGKTQL